MGKKNNVAKKINTDQKPDEIKESANKEGVLALNAILSKKYQQTRQDGDALSPLELNLLKFDSLTTAQEKIVELEQEIEQLYSANESLTSSGEVLQDKISHLLAKVEDSQNQLTEEKKIFEEEKQIVLNALEDTKKEVSYLQKHKQELENRLSKDLQTIRVRENALENRLELLKSDGAVLQRDKDNKIIELQKKIQKLNWNLQSSYKKYKELQNQTDQLKARNRKTVSVLRTIIHNLEGARITEQAEDLAGDSDKD